MKSTYNIAIIGATGLVGATVLSILEERHFPIDKLYLLASNRSVGEICEFKDKSYLVEDLKHFDFTQTQICFFCVDNKISAEYAPKAAAAGNIVIDKSSHYRYQNDVPLVVPEVNSNLLSPLPQMRIIANPNCTTIPIIVVLKPIYDAVGIKRVNIATYQSVSGTGKQAVTELVEETIQLLNGQSVHPKAYPQQIAFNVLPHCDQFQENGYTKEEMKMVWEIQKILNDDQVAVNPTAVRVPVFFGHSAAIHLETTKKITAAEVEELLAKSPGIKVMTGKYPYPTPVKDAAGRDAVFVGRIREDISHKNGINLWVVSDNVRKGAALNGVQIAEKLIAEAVI